MERQKLESTKLFEGGEYTHQLKNGEKVVGTAKVTREVTADMIESVVVGAFEGGSNYWIGRVEKHFADGTHVKKGKPTDMPFSQWCTELILEGKTIGLVIDDGEFDDNETVYLNLEKLIKGFEMYWKKHQPYNFDGDADAGDDDCVIQYAVFGQLVYG